MVATTCTMYINHVELFHSHDDKNQEVPCNGRDHVTSHTSSRKSPVVVPPSEESDLVYLSTPLERF